MAKARRSKKGSFGIVSDCKGMWDTSGDMGENFKGLNFDISHYHDGEQVDPTTIIDAEKQKKISEENLSSHF